jgi:hypothetical protein
MESKYIVKAGIQTTLQAVIVIIDLPSYTLHTALGLHSRHVIDGKIGKRTIHVARNNNIALANYFYTLKRNITHEAPTNFGHHG